VGGVALCAGEQGGDFLAGRRAQLEQLAVRGAVDDGRRRALRRGAGKNEKPLQLVEHRMRYLGIRLGLICSSIFGYGFSVAVTGFTSNFTIFGGSLGLPVVSSSSGVCAIDFTVSMPLITFLNAV